MKNWDVIVRGEVRRWIQEKKENWWSKYV